ncbi:GNAT family N-acetyltransferase [Mycolicibacterium sp. CBMA 226]|uniref:GNAT family N-acetyltransferase n=1 Tax=Mycolicibacterium sp. CBMA 226 TaxID=2606611 RepID=UPI0012DF0493|nr:GNAT family N-acetyltransferase [Mycolicibacterium sp. CBMA 226]MUL74893.1 GNAT family N-acetyltransferase [Mycolicibacterium sp. CBMA 226]
MTGTGVIRLTEADWRMFAALRLRALADSAGTDDAEYRTEMSFTGTQWRRRLRAHAQFALADEDRLVGLIAAHRASPSSVYLYSLWTDPVARGHGVAHTLLTAAIEWGRGLGARTVTLRVHRNNAAALAVYRAFGFVATADPADGSQNPGRADELTMSLTLS